MIPQQNDQTPVGLAGLQKSGVGATNQTKNIEYFFNLAKKMSDGQLADILSGKSLGVPQFVAMTEAMGRKQLRQAAEGAQAQQLAKQPSVKEKLLAENAVKAAGLDQLAAPNLETMGEGHAAGGIIAFDKGGDVFERWKQLGGWGQNTGIDETDAEYLKATNPAEYEKQKRQTDKWKRLADANKQPYLAEDFRASVVDPIKNFFTSPWDKAAIADTQKAEVSRLMKENNISAAEALKLLNKSAPLPTATETAAFTGNGTSVPPANTNAPAANPNAPAASPAAPASAVDVSAPTTFERRANPFAQMRADAVDETGIKDRGMGFGLMKLASHVISTPGTRGFGEGINALADQGLLTQKELKDAKKDARDYNFNIMKASEAAEQGNDELALKYKALAEQTDYHKTMGKAAMITAQAHATAASNKGAGATQLSIKDATKEFNDLTPAQKRALPIGVTDARTYWQYVNGNFSGFVNAAPGEGATILSPKS